MIDLSKYKVHDLTHTFSEQIAGFSTTPARTIAENGWNATWLKIYSHAGTHMDAPFHFEVSDQTIDQFQPKEVMGKAWVVEIKISKGQQLLEISDLGEVIGKFQVGDSLLLHTNWSQKIEDATTYKNQLPRISKELATWCVENQVKMLGVEPPSVADVNNLPEVTEIHEILLGGKVIIIEGLKNLNQIKSETVFLIALPIKYKNGDGAPARVIALEEL
ncbi:MAG: cyclase family protein [Bacteroidota bacterium]